MSIDWNGRIKPCVLSDFFIGKINAKFNYSSFLERSQKIFEAFTNLESPTEKDCNNCEYIRYCCGCIIRGMKKMRKIGLNNCKRGKHYEKGAKVIETNIK